MGILNKVAKSIGKKKKKGGGGFNSDAQRRGFFAHLLGRARSLRKSGKLSFIGEYGKKTGRKTLASVASIKSRRGNIRFEAARMLGLSAGITSKGRIGHFRKKG